MSVRCRDLEALYVPVLLFSRRTMFSPLVSIILIVHGFTGRAGLEFIILKEKRLVYIYDILM